MNTFRQKTKQNEQNNNNNKLLTVVVIGQKNQTNIFFFSDSIKLFLAILSWVGSAFYSSWAGHPFL